MQANALHLSLIEIQVSKGYYGGYVEGFYLRDHKDIYKLDVHKEWEDEQYCYYHAQHDLDITKTYDIINTYGLSVVLQYRKLIHMPMFDETFYYSNMDLGSSYQKEQTIWKVWAPTALEVLLYIHEDNKTYPMIKDKQGVFSVTLLGDYQGIVYTYLVKHASQYQEVLDPYSYGSSVDANASVVIDLERCIKETNKNKLPTMHKKTEAIIYETSVRDMTIDRAIACQYPGKYLGFVEEGLKTPENHNAGLDYMVSLGITHVQIMPMYDFATVEENHPDLFYNWGYDPRQYNVPEGSYSTNPNHPYTRIMECQTMISKLHEKGLRVVMDCVYNHMYDVSQCAYEAIVPGYFFRRNMDGSLSNGSWCGNDVNSAAKMVRKYIVDMALRWVNIYGVDGLRLDLMGLMDIQTLQDMYDACSTSDPNFIMYGEGWNMETALLYEQRGVQGNHQKMPHIGFFNDLFRDKLKGLSSDNNLHDKGYFSGNMYNTDALCQCLKNNNRYSLVSQSINYTECHDNATIYDKYSISNAEENETLRQRRQKLLTMASILAQGIAFLHSGQEWYRSKKGTTNSYNRGDIINKIDWQMVDKYQEDIQDIQKIITFRKTYSNFWYDTNEEVEANVKTEMFDNQMVKYTLQGNDDNYQSLVIYINGSNQSYKLDLPKDYDILYMDKNIKEMVEISPVSMVILGVR
jgi:pullulanase